MGQVEGQEAVVVLEAVDQGGQGAEGAGGEVQGGQVLLVGLVKEALQAEEDKGRVREGVMRDVDVLQVGRDGTFAEELEDVGF